VTLDEKATGAWQIVFYNKESEVQGLSGTPETSTTGTGVCGDGCANDPTGEYS